MKSFHLLLLLPLFVLTLASCTNDEPEPVVEMLMLDLQNDSLIREGLFMREVHATSGTVKLYRRSNNQLLVLDNFKTDNGHDLYVYLSKDQSVSNSLNLGKLKSNSGTFSYEIDAAVYISQYPYVLIWCRDFAVLFGSAQLEKP